VLSRWQILLAIYLEEDLPFNQLNQYNLSKIILSVTFLVEEVFLSLSHRPRHSLWPTSLVVE